MDGLRVLLIIVGFLVILAALTHGLWSIRKNSRKQRVTRKAEPSFSTSQPSAGKTDTSGFDELGIGAVRTVKTSAHKAANKTEQANQTGHTAAKPHTDKTADSAEVQQAALFDDEESAGPSEETVTEHEQPTVEQLPMSFPEEEQKQPSISSTSVTDETEENVPELGSLDTVEEVEEEAQEPSEATKKDEAPTEKLPEVISLYVSGDIQGAILLQTVTELGFKFGDMDIFHRHVDTAGKGPTLFSMANMFNPGVFDLDEIETFSTRGVVLFMELPVPGDGHKAFTMMYNAANKIAEAMPRAAVLDSNRNPITKQSVQHTYQRIREFERRQHVAGAARHSS